MAKKMPEIGDYKYGFHDKDVSIFRSKRGLTKDIVEEISRMKDEPQWMLDYRLKALEIFYSKPMPQWGGDLGSLDFDEITYYVKPSEATQKSWDEVPEEIKATFDKLGIPEAEQKYLAGVSAQYESEVVYHNMKQELEDMGIVFKDTDSALRDRDGDPGDRCRRQVVEYTLRAALPRIRRLGLRHLRRLLLPQPRGRRGRRRQHRRRGRALPYPFANKVTLVHRRDDLRAEKILQARLFANHKVSVVWDSVVEEILGTGEPVTASAAATPFAGGGGLAHPLRLPASVSRNLKTGAISRAPRRRCVRRHRPRSVGRVRRRPAPHEAVRLHVDRPELDRDQHSRRLRRRRRDRRDLPPGGDGGGNGLHGGTRGGEIPGATATGDGGGGGVGR